MLSDVFKKNIKKNSDGSITNVICNSAKNGLIPQREYFDKDIANAENTQGYYIIENGDFVYNPRKSTEAPYGPVSIYKYEEAGIVSPLYLCFRAIKNINSSFFDYFFKSSAWHRYIYLSGDSGARHDRVSIKDDVFFAMPLYLPSHEEQNKIALFLSFLESRIEKQRLLVEHLKKYKRGLLSSLFAQKLDANVFEYETWNISDFDELFYTVPDKPFQVQTNEYFEHGIYEVVDQGKKKIVGYNDSKNKLFTQIPVIVYGDHTTIIKYRTTPFIVGGDGVKLLKCKVENHLGYMYYALCHFNIEQEGYKRHFSILKNIKLPIPPLNIQEKIYTIFSELDVKIEEHEELLLRLNSFKKGILQKMFI